MSHAPAVSDDTKEAVEKAIEKTVEAAEDAIERPGMVRLARLGFYTKGVLFLVIGSLSIALLVGFRGGRLADATGALSAISAEPFGRVLLVIFVVGAVGHGVWNILRGAADVDSLGRKWHAIVRRVISVGIGVFYLGLALSAAEIVAAAGVPSGSSRAEETFVALVLAALPLGFLYVMLIGLGLVAAGFSECYNGLSGKFRENYRLWSVGRLHLAFINILGAISFSARAVLLVMTGYFFIRAPFDDARDLSIGLDAALLALLQSSYGPLLVLAIAVGLIGHGILAFYEAKYRRIC